MKVAIALFSTLVAVYAKAGVPLVNGPAKFGISTDGKIVGGEEAEKYSIPYQLSLQVKSPLGGYDHYCGASVLSSNRALTSANCVYVVNPNQTYISVVGAEYNLAETEGFEQRLRVVEVVVHPKFSYTSSKYDIAILKLAGHFNITDKLAPAHLPELNQEFEGTAIASGWGTCVKGSPTHVGTLGAGGPEPEVLYKVEMPIVPNNECDREYILHKVHDSMICAGEEGKDACTGDYGGPLTCEGIQCGIISTISWSRECGEKGKPGVYTRISHYLDFIKEHMD